VKQILGDFGLNFDHIPIKCDKTSTINLSKNPIQHSYIKHNKVRHHFLRDHIMKDDIILEFVSIKYQLTNIFTKPLGKDQFCEIRRNLCFIHTNDI